MGKLNSKSVFGDREPDEAAIRKGKRRIAAQEQAELQARFDETQARDEWLREMDALRRGDTEAVNEIRNERKKDLVRTFKENERKAKRQMAEWLAKR